MTLIWCICKLRVYWRFIVCQGFFLRFFELNCELRDVMVRSIVILNDSFIFVKIKFSRFFFLAILNFTDQISSSKQTHLLNIFQYQTFPWISSSFNFNVTTQLNVPHAFWKFFFLFFTHSIRFPFRRIFR